MVIEKQMEKRKLIKILQKILKTDHPLEFLLKLSEKELENLIALIRDRVEGDK